MIFQPNRNVWRVARASRAAVLIDAAAYFAALRRALLKAQRSVVIAGWDIHSQARLVGREGTADDGYPEEFAAFLTRLVAERPELEVCVLLWDFSVLYAAERDLFPTLTLAWNTPSRIRFCLDDCVPIGSSQHQKLVVIDDALAFAGGLDITVRRWDTSRHRLDEPGRVDPAGKPYRPFHDVQMMVDGAAARALGELVRARWACAACEELAATEVEVDLWPEHVEPDFTDVKVGIARTQPRYEQQKQVDEVERLYLDMIDKAERTIYIENQFLTASAIADRLARRLRERPALEVVLVSPDAHESWLEAQSMRAGRLRFVHALREAGGERVYFAYPKVADGDRAASVMVHAKVMIVDDTLLRVGSANLNNRSMGTDTECDLVIAAQDDTQRKRITQLRDGLLGHHCGATRQEVADTLAQKGGSLVQAARTLERNGHSLVPIADEGAGGPDLGFIQGVADPERPIGAEEFIGTVVGGRVSSRHVALVAKVLGAGLFIIALALAWQFMPLAKPEVVRGLFAELAGSRLAPLLVVGAFVLAGFVLFPVTVLIAATAAAFGPWLGFAYAAAGALASALVTYAVGAAVGKRTLRDILGPRLNRIRQKAADRGVITVAALRMVPIAPFTVVNLVAGASSIPVIAYAAGTFIGMLPGLITISAVGHQFARILTAPTPADFAWLAAAVAAWIALSIGVQALVARYWSGAR
ncbi:MAG: VTT domain-containing protein [Pseudolabrys sp.]